jgi:(4S)-4-hydroxy-5-phosphonooxypentane-2,3-dione isomerase
LEVLPMLALVVEFRIHAAHVAAFEAAILANARASREGEPGCRQFDVCRDPADPAVFHLYELYDDEAAIQAHLRSSHFLQMDALTAAWVQDKRVRKLLRQAP